MESIKTKRIEQRFSRIHRRAVSLSEFQQMTAKFVGAKLNSLTSGMALRSYTWNHDHRCCARPRKKYRKKIKFFELEEEQLSIRIAS